MLFQGYTDEEMIKVVDKFIWIYDGHGFLFEYGIDREYMIIKARDETLINSLPRAVKGELEKPGMPSMVCH